MDATSYTKGYNDAKAGRPNAFPPLTELSNLQVGLSLGAELHLAAGTVTLPVGILKATRPIKIFGNGTTILFTWQGAAHGAAPVGLDIVSDGVEITGVNFGSDKPGGPNKINISGIRTNGAKTKLTDLNFSNLDNGIICLSGSTGTGTNLQFDATMRSDPLYIGGAKYWDFVDCNSEGSTIEHGLRVETEYGTNANIAGFLTFTRCNFKSQNVKEGSAIRNAGGGPVSFIDCPVNFPIRAGQVSTPAPTITVLQLIVQGCIFNGPQAVLQLNQGVTAIVTGNTFQDHAAYCPIHVNGPHVNITGDGNKLLSGPGGNGDTIMSVALAPTDVVKVGFVKP